MFIRFTLPLTQITGKSSFVDETDGTLFVSFEDRRFQPSSLQNVLSSFGELLSFEATEPHEQVCGSRDLCGHATNTATHIQLYHVEYCDVRDAASR